MCAETVKDGEPDLEMFLRKTRESTKRYALLLDKSKTGLGILQQLSRRPEESGILVNCDAVKTWEANAEREFVVLMGKWGQEAQFVLSAIDIQQVLGQILPSVFSFSFAAQDQLGFIPAVDFAHVIPIMNKWGELQQEHVQPKKRNIH